MHFVKHWVPVILWAAVILAAANDELSSQSTARLLDRIFGFEVPEVWNVIVRKLAHITEYAILAALTWRADRRPTVVFGIALAVAVADETRQGFMTMTRGGSPFDVLIDLIGAYVGFTAVAAMRARLASRGRAR